MMNWIRLAVLLPVILLCRTAFPVRAEEPGVVSLSPSLTELVFQLGKGHMLVGRSSACDFPDPVRKLPAAGNFGDPDLERVLKLKPSLVITTDLMKPGKGKVLTQAGIRLVRMQCRNMAEYILWTGKLGELLNCREAAAAEIARIRKELDSFQREARKIRHKKKVCWVIWDSPLMIAGSGSLPENVILYAGAVNLAENLHPEYIKASKDFLLKNQPDILIWTCTRPLNRQDRFWRALKAVRTGAVIYAPDCSELLRPGPRLPLGIRKLKREMEKLP